MKKNNILILSHDYYPNNIWGVGKNVYDFINSNFNVYDIVLYTAFPRKQNPNYKVITTTESLYKIFLKGNYIKNNSFRDCNLLSALNVLIIKRIINYYDRINEKPDIILNHGWMTWQIASVISKKYKIKVISFVHFFEKQFLLSNNLSSKTDWDDIYDIEKLMFNDSYKLIVFSENQKKQIYKLYNLKKKNIKIINHSVELPKLPSIRKDNNKIKILFVGRLIQDKGIQELIRAFNKLSEKYHNLELTIVGDGVLRKKIKSLKNKNIICTGWLDGKELFKQYIENDIFCFPTKSETFGIVLIEAMRYKIPIITTEGDTVSNIVENNRTGLTIKLHKQDGKISLDLNELCMNIEKLINNKEIAKTLSKNAYKEYLKKYKNSEINEINNLIEENLEND